MDVGRSIGAPFKDAQWPMKVGIGGLLGLLFVTAPAVGGAQMDYVRKVANGDDTLPDWNDLGGQWVRGFLLFVGMLVYALPAMILGGVALVPVLLTLIGGPSSDAAAAAGLGGACLFGGIAVLWLILVSIFSLAGMVNFAMTGNFGAMFAFGDIMKKIRGGNGYFMAWAVSIAVNFVAGTVISVLSSTGVGGLLAPWVMFVGYMITSHVFGQWAAVAYGVGTQSPVAASGAAGYTPPAPPAPPGDYPPAPPAGYPPAPPAPPAGYPPAPPADYPPAPPAPPAAPAPPIEPDGSDGQDS